MKPITFSTSYPSHQQTTLFADVRFPTMAFLDAATIDGRRIWGPARGEIQIRLPAPIMTDYRGPYRSCGAVLSVTIANHVMSGIGVLTERFPDDVDLYPAVSLAGHEVYVSKRGHRVRFEHWGLDGVTLHTGGQAWDGLLPVVITPREVARNSDRPSRVV